jgi:PhnB protein
MARLNPYLQFNGNCREAMGFYRECLGGELQIQTFGESPMAEGMPAEMRDQVLHSALNSDAMVLMASDGMSGHQPHPGSAVILCINSDDAHEIKALFAKFAVGATITQPLVEEFFGWYGALTDRYGINWMFQAGAAPSA